MKLLRCASALLSIASHLSQTYATESSKASVSYEKRELLQNIVTWDEASLKIHGEKVMLYSAEIHLFRHVTPV